MARWKAVLRIAQWSLIVIGFISLPVPYFASWKSEKHNAKWDQEDWEEGRPSIQSITTLQDTVQRFIGHWSMSIIALGIMLPVMGMICRAGSAFTWIGCFGISIFTILCSCAGVIAYLPPWVSGPPCRSDNGRLLYVMESSFLQGQTLVIAELESDHWPFRTSKVLVETNGDSPQSWQSMVRPATTDDDGILASQISPDGVLFGFRYDNRAFFAYDLVNKLPIGRSRIRRVSPFALLGPTTPVHQPDVLRIKGIVQELDEQYTGVPHEADLKAGMDHPNPTAATLARKLLEIRKK